jgi:5-methyltetrahydrofolate--homocysteine methyltransferase
LLKLTNSKPKLLGLPALLSTTMPAMRDTVKAIREAGLAVKVIIGGAPITHEFARETCTFGYSPDVSSAMDTAIALLQGKP